MASGRNIALREAMNKNLNDKVMKETMKSNSASSTPRAFGRGRRIIAALVLGMFLSCLTTYGFTLPGIGKLFFYLPR